MTAINQITIHYNRTNYQFYQMTPGDLNKAKVIFIGHTETRSDHFYSIAVLLNSVATKRDLLLVEYVDRGMVVPLNRRNEVRALNLLVYYGFTNKKITIKGWDNTRFGPAIARMTKKEIPIKATTHSYYA